VRPEPRVILASTGTAYLYIFAVSAVFPELFIGGVKLFAWLGNPDAVRKSVTGTLLEGLSLLDDPAGYACE
jgi:hypothetical protein